MLYGASVIIEEKSKPLYEYMGGHEGILRFIRPFYMDLRQHQELGPIFNRHIQDWESHLAKITEFWALQTGGPSHYRGGFAGAHFKIDGLTSDHFDQWLALWDFNCQRQLPPDLQQSMSQLAHTLAARLKRVVARPYN
ncbi:MAG: group III truncated hemoglobin [Verrucomicrobia bacterium]|nr:group III truncated hemoglobin [Verrucomicrobiota bacterium]